MTDPSDEPTAIDVPPEGPMMQDNAPLRPELIATQLQRSESDRELETFRTLINIKIRLDDPKSSSEWNLVIVELLRIITSSDDVGEEQVLLASLALVNVSFRSCRFEDFEQQLRSYWSLEDPLLKAFDENFEIRDLEWFKLVVTHGYLRVNIETIYKREIIAVPFEVLQKNCLAYTNYSYFAYKTLQTWLEKTAKTDFWSTNEATETEKKLEMIIFSNWDSCICEIARRNATQIFPTYLRIMSKKYEGYLNFAFKNCMENLSWQNELKYTILAEICKIWEDVPQILSSDLPSCLFTSLTKNHLKHPGTVLYLTILGKLRKYDWEDIFSEAFFRTSEIWESEEQLAAIDLLWMQWMTPTIAKFPNIFTFLSRHGSMYDLKLSQSYLTRIGVRQGLQSIGSVELDAILKDIIHLSEPMRLNAFAILCQLNNWTVNFDEDEPFVAVKKFLYFNIDTSSVIMRKGIVKNFEILFNNLVRSANGNSKAEPQVFNLLRWLHKFLLDCFEIGVCYQRKILAMSLYEVILTLTSFDDCRMGIWNAEKSRGESRKLINYAINLRKRMNGTERWLYCDAKCARKFYTMVCDRMTEVRDKAAFMLLQYFSSDVFPAEESEYRWSMNHKYHESSQFYDVEIGAAIEKLKIAWDSKFEPPLYDGRISTVVDHVSRARNQLSEMKRCDKGILHCLENGSPVYGSLTVVLEVGFLVGPVDKIYDESTVRKILDLVEDVTKFFLAALSVKSKTGKYSSSFAEMGQAIENTISQSDKNTNDCNLTPAHQLLISCIWMSLKVSCEIAAEIGLIAETEEFARRSVDLIVSVLLKCRHKGAIEAAGLALAKLTKYLSKGKYNGLIESHLTNLLNIDKGDNINLTRRGAGLSIMFHKIVTSDDRRNCPWLHLAVRKLLDSLKIEKLAEYSSTESVDCLVDLPRARHMHFLRSLVIDKSLQAQLVPYIEDICLTCFRYLQSIEWTVRNASLRLFGAIVPRLVGQCSAQELDYGIGNSVEHFITHYPILAKAVMTKLTLIASQCCHAEGYDLRYVRTDNDVAPILTLLSKMSCGGCYFVDNTSRSYIIEARNAFRELFKHPVVNIRVLASKAYAAFVPLPDIPCELIMLRMETLCKSKMNNHEHGNYCTQLYLQRKLKHELQCTSETFVIPKHTQFRIVLSRSNFLQLRLLARIVNRWISDEKQICYTVASALIKCLMESPVTFFSSDLPLNWTTVHRNISRIVEEHSKPGLNEFLDDLMSLSAQIGVVHDTSMLSEIFYGAMPHCYAHRVAVMKNLKAERRNLEILVDEALVIFDDRKKSDILLTVVRTIRDIPNVEVPENLRSKLRHLSLRLEKIKLKSRPYARLLRSFATSIALRFLQFDVLLMERITRYMCSCIKDPCPTTDELIIDCVARTIAAGERLRENDVPIFMKCGGRILFEVIIITLVSENPETRESMAKTLQPIIESLIGITGYPICARACVHKILNKLSLLWGFNRYEWPDQYDYTLKLFMRLMCRIKLHLPLNYHGPPVQDYWTDQDDSLFNILIYCVKTFVEQRVPRDDRESDEMQQIDDAIDQKHEFERKNNFEITDLKSLVQLDRINYLANKKLTLLEMIGAHRSGDSINDLSCLSHFQFS